MDPDKYEAAFNFGTLPYVSVKMIVVVTAVSAHNVEDAPLSTDTAFTFSKISKAD